MADLATKPGEMAAYDSTPSSTAFGLMVGGLTVKVALFPLHTWQPDAYANAPDTVSAFISAPYRRFRHTRSPACCFPCHRGVPGGRARRSLGAGRAGVREYRRGKCARRLAGQRPADAGVLLGAQFGLVIAGFAIATPLAVVGATVHLLGHAVMKGGLPLRRASSSARRARRR